MLDAALIADDDDLVTYVGRLEDMVDEMNEHDEAPVDDSDIDDTDPGQLAAEVEQFLRNRDADG